MPEQVQKILDKILEWWKKFNTKQKTLLISITGVVFLTLGILVFVVSQPTYETLITCADATEAASVNSILQGDSSIDYEVSPDGLTFSVNAKNKATAIYLLGENGVPSPDFSIDNVMDGSFSQTEADKEKRYQVYLEAKFESHLEILENVESATVDLTLPDNDGTILSREEQSSAAVTLQLSGSMDSDQAYGIAQFIATELGNDSTDGITIIDTKANVLYSGADSQSAIGNASSQLSYKQKMENMINEKIKGVLVSSKIYSNVEVAPNLDIDFTETNTATHEYYAPDGQTDGMISSQDVYSSESTNGGLADEPGTGSNDADVTYVTQDNEGSSATVDETKTEYQNNESITETSNSGGNVNYDNSSVSIVATRYVVYDEEVLEAAGELEDMTFDEFVTANSEPVAVDVDETFYDMIANATGFSTDAISILCYEQPEFVYADTTGRSLQDILQIALAVLIFALLGYVVFRSTRSQQEQEMEPELSVESLLQSTAEAQEDLDDIGYNEKSETRILIEKFVDENPDAVALLLRNWLNEEWE